MKRYLAVLIALAASSVGHAGVTYRFRTVTAGIVSSTMAGTVRTERGITRADLLEGDALLFRAGSSIISRAGTSAIVVADAKRKSWYELRLEDVVRGGPLAGAMGALGELKVENERVTVTERGAGPKLAGQSTVRTTTDASYDVLVAGNRIRVSSTIDTWTAPALPHDSAGLFQLQGIATGIPAVDRLLTLQGRAPRGFIVRQVTVARVVIGDQQWVSKTTTSVQEIAIRPIAPNELEVPSGYRKIASPFAAR